MMLRSHRRHVNRLACRACTHTHTHSDTCVLCGAHTSVNICAPGNYVIITTLQSHHHWAFRSFDTGVPFSCGRSLVVCVCVFFINMNSGPDICSIVLCNLRTSTHTLAHRDIIKFSCVERTESEHYHHTEHNVCSNSSSSSSHMRGQPAAATVPDVTEQWGGKHAAPLRHTHTHTRIAQKPVAQRATYAYAMRCDPIGAFISITLQRRWPPVQRRTW